MNILEYIEKNTLEIRNCITRYIGFIISATLVSGILGTIIFSTEHILSSLIILSTTLTFVTFLFQIIWYKFKSHNRFEGFKFLISHETDYIKKQKLKVKKEQKDYLFDKCNEKEKKYLESKNRTKKKDYELVKNKKLYIKFYKDFISNFNADKINNLHSFNIALSRINDSYLTNRSLDNDKLLSRYLNSSNKTQFVFSTSTKNYDFIKINDYDKKFFNEIVWKIYGNKKMPLSIRYSLKTIFHKDIEIPDNFFGVDNKYATVSWKYPKLITKISLLSILGLFSLFIIKLIGGYSYDLHYFSSVKNFLKMEFENFLPLLLFLFNCFILYYWFTNYVLKINELIFGRYSIEGYLWKFFIHRVQYLNRVHDVIPIYFSRNFARFFKTNLVIRYLDKVFEDSKVSQEKEKFIKKTIIDILPDTINSYSQFEIEVFGIEKEICKEGKKVFYSKYVNTYYEKLKTYKSFDDNERIIHKILTKAAKNVNYKIF